MFKNKYSNFLTIILILLIIAILVVASVVIVKTIKANQEEKEKRKVFAEIQDGSEDDDNNDDNQNNTENNSTIEDFINGAPIENTTGNNTTSGGEGTGGTQRRRLVFYKEYPVVGYIKIPKTKVDYPVLLDVSPGALDTAVGVMYPNNPTLNTPGNILIIGHNFRNGKFFSNNKKLVVGDVIQITDLTGKTLTYTIYEILTLPDTDTSYVTRDTGGKIEISLSTCTDDGSGRLVILARVE